MVDTKMKVLSQFTFTSFQTCMTLFFLQNINGLSMCTKNALPIFFKIKNFVYCRRKSGIQVWIITRVNNYGISFNCPICNVFFPSSFVWMPFKPVAIFNNHLITVILSNQGHFTQPRLHSFSSHKEETQSKRQTWHSPIPFQCTLPFTFAFKFAIAFSFNTHLPTKQRCKVFISALLLCVQQK